MAMWAEEDYKRIGQLAAREVESIITAPSLQDLEEIRQTVSTITDEAKCINTTVVHLVEKLQSRKRSILPGQETCKEPSAHLASILRSLGYTAKIAMINKGTEYIEEDMLAGALKFNYFVVKVLAPSGKMFWVDPMDITTMVKGVSPDIADRPALVLDLKEPTYDYMPPEHYQYGVDDIEETMSIESPKRSRESKKLSAKGKKRRKQKR